MNKNAIIGVMGGGEASPEAARDAYILGKLIAEKGWVLLNGGRNSGIMEASARGAAEAGGLTVGILPDDHGQRTSEYVAVQILTGMGSARNSINVLSSHVVIACPGGAGTVSEIALALKFGRKVVLLNFDPGKVFDRYRKSGDLVDANSPEEAVGLAEGFLEQAIDR